MTLSGYDVAHSGSVSKHAAAIHNTENNSSPEDK